MNNPSDWHVLVVEDEPDGLEVVMTMLDTVDIRTQGAYSAEEGMRLLQEQAFTGVIIDLALPQKDGWDLLKFIRSHAELAHLPCIAMTAFHNSTVRHEAQQAGFDAYFPKPLNDRTFIDDVINVFANAN